VQCAGLPQDSAQNANPGFSSLKSTNFLTMHTIILTCLWELEYVSYHPATNRKV